jgi:hypothetical protein
MLRRLTSGGQAVRRWLASRATLGNRRAPLRRPSACFGLWCDPTIVECSRDFLAARSA